MVPSSKKRFKSFYELESVEFTTTSSSDAFLPVTYDTFVPASDTNGCPFAVYNYKLTTSETDSQFACFLFGDDGTVTFAEQTTSGTPRIATGPAVEGAPPTDPTDTYTVSGTFGQDGTPLTGSYGTNADGSLNFVDISTAAGTLSASHYTKFTTGSIKEIDHFIILIQLQIPCHYYISSYYRIILIIICVTIN